MIRLCRCGMTEPIESELKNQVEYDMDEQGKLHPIEF